MTDFVVGIIFAIVIMATCLVVWQLVLMIKELTDTLRSVRNLTDQIKHDIEPTMKEVQGVMEKVNGTMENLETLNKKVKSAQVKADKAWTSTKKTAGKASSRVKDYLLVAKVGVLTAVDVIKGNPTPQADYTSLPEAKTEVKLPPKEDIKTR